MQFDAGQDLPGFRITREFASSAGQRLYLAHQGGVDRWVVLKFSPLDATLDQGSPDPFTKKVWAAAAKLAHPDIVAIHDILQHGTSRVVVLEYIAGGDLRQRLQAGMRIGDLAKMVSVLGSALDDAHGQGFLHLDIRPESILFRSDNRPVLSDFSGGWQMDLGEPPADYVARAGTPGFMSPEQAAGRVVDPSADLYSLGAVLHNILVGQPPHHSDVIPFGETTWHQERAARLPAHLRPLQPIVDRSLAAHPKQRYPRVADLAKALEQASRQPALVGTTFKSVAVSTDEIRAVTAGLLTTPDAPTRQQRRLRRERKSRRRTIGATALLALVVVGIGYLSNNTTPWVGAVLGEMGLVEDARLRTAWRDAQSLHLDPNQSLSAIVAGYQRVLAMDVEHVEAQAALAGLAEQWRAGVIESLSQNDLVQAETKLAEMSTAFANHSALADLRGQLANRTTAEALLTSTQALLRSHGLSDVSSATAAIQAYHEVMRLAPGHPVALKELNVLGEHYAGLAQEAVQQGDVPGAISFLERATAANSDLPLLSEIRSEIQQATTARAAIDELLQLARTYRVEGMLVTPPGENAAELYNRVLATAPDNALARQGLSEVASQLLTQASRMLEEDDFVGLGALVDQASAAGAESDELLQIRNRMEQRVNDLEMVADNLGAAESLLREGFITEPPERNAVSLLREVERLDPGNAQAQSLLEQAAVHLVEAAVEAHAVGLTAQAKQYLELALTVTPDVPAWRTLRASWE